MITMHPFKLFIALPALAALSACTLGPDYAGPPQAAPHATQSAHFVRTDDATLTGSAPVNEWWQAWADPLLTELIERALAANPNLNIAKARLQQARAALNLEHANTMPSTGASALYAHAHLPSISSTDTLTDLNLYGSGFDASWEIDLYGGQKRGLQAANATAESVEATLADVQVSLGAEVASAYISLRERQQRIVLGEQEASLQEHMLTLTQQRFASGTATRLELQRLQNQLDTTRADLLPLRTEVDAYLNQLATLVGQEPGTLDEQLSVAGPVLLPPATVAVGNPSDLLRHRPDIRAAERMLAADTAKIGQTQAARYPSIKLLGFIGLGGTQASDLTRLDDFSALLAPSLSWNFLDFGRNAARVTQAEEVRNEAEMKYRQAVLEALRDAEDSLSRFRQGRQSVATMARTKATADATLTLVRQRYEAGTTTYIDVLDSTRQLAVAQQNLVQAEANLTRSFITIQKALGLGWRS